MELPCPNRRTCSGRVTMTIEAGTYGTDHHGLDYVIAAVGGDEGRSCTHGCRLSAAQIGRLCRDAADAYSRQSAPGTGLLRR